MVKYSASPSSWSERAWSSAWVQVGTSVRAGAQRARMASTCSCRASAMAWSAESSRSASYLVLVQAWTVSQSRWLRLTITLSLLRK